jgi:hypothetical protein
MYNVFSFMKAVSYLIHTGAVYELDKKKHYI